MKYPPLRQALAQFHVTRELGAGHVFRRKGEAIPRIVKRLDPDVCARCQTRIFFECPPPPAPNAGAGAPPS